MRFDVISLFPEAFSSYLTTSIVGRAQKRGLIHIQLHQLREFATDTHRTTDDTPYGGGAGMVMKIEPIDRALQQLAADVPRDQQHIVVLSARGQQFTQAKARALATSTKSLTLICGRYEGVDQRVADHLANEEVSIGPYVLAGGELAALVIIETVARMVPGVLGNPDSLKEESFSSTPYPPTRRTRRNGGHPTPSIEYPQYTKPEEYKGWKVPEVLLSGNHAAIAAWRAQQQAALDQTEQK